MGEVSIPMGPSPLVRSTPQWLTFEPAPVPQKGAQVLCSGSATGYREMSHQGHLGHLQKFLTKREILSHQKMAGLFIATWSFF